MLQACSFTKDFSPREYDRGLWYQAASLANSASERDSDRGTYDPAEAI